MGFLLLLFGGVVALDSAVHPTFVERRIERVLRSELKSVGEVHVHVRAAGAMEAANGNLKQVDITLQRFRLEDVSLSQFTAVEPETTRGPAVTPVRLRAVAPERRVGFPLPVRRDPATRYPAESVIGTLRLVATDFTHGGYPLDSLTVTLRQVRYDPSALFGEERLAVRGMTGGDAVFRLGASTIQALAAAKAPEVDNLKVRLKRGHVQVTGSKTLLTTPLKFTCEAALRAVGDLEVALVDGKANIDGVDLPDGVVQTMLDKLNPVFTAPVRSLAPLTARIRDVVVTPDGIWVRLTLRLPHSDDRNAGTE